MDSTRTESVAAPGGVAGPILEVRNLHKRYGRIGAVNGLDLSIEAGICFGLLGPNGAGKTTTLEMLEGILEASSGEILYRGKPCGAGFRQDSGIMFQHTALQDLLKVGETLELFSDFYHHPRPLAEVVERCALEAILDQQTRQLSGGQHQRLLLAIALINDPAILFLDEPTTGLDPQARRNFWQLVRNIKAEGKTLILTTHYMEEAWELCDEIAIMDQGRIIASGSPRGLLRKHFDNTVITLPIHSTAEPRGEEILGVYRDKQQLEIVTTDINKTLTELLGKGIRLDGIGVRSPDLEDLFLELTGHTLRS